MIQKVCSQKRMKMYLDQYRQRLSGRSTGEVRSDGEEDKDSGDLRPEEAEANGISFVVF